jgi:hypothetical protein
MTEAVTKELLEKYPSAFKTLRYGSFACRDGWRSLIEELGEHAQARKLRVEVVKEKFGYLRVYFFEMDGLGEDLQFLRSLEDRSSRMCEGCGNPGRLYGAGGDRGGWMQVHCEVCEAKHLEFLAARRKEWKKQK